MRGMVERRLMALALITVGVWLEWSLGVALIVAGAGVAVSGVDPRSLVDNVVARTQGSVRQLRATAAANPRGALRVSAVALVSLGAVLLPVAAMLAVGIWAALAVLAVILIIDGHLLGWE
jgi:hypothetical protein